MNTYDIFPTMITPYNKDGSVDYETAEKYVDWYYEHGCTGVFAVCQSSEIFYLTLEERVELNRRVWQRAKALEEKYGRKFTVVSSGHVSDDLDDQVEELTQIAKTGTDAIILITNRLDLNNEGDDVWIANAEKLLARLPKGIKLGVYECPYPYKRLLTEKILKWCISTGHFYYGKDTCCDAEEIARRNQILNGTSFKLLNANCQTLLDSLKTGGYGYCGVMANFHPKAYVWLVQNFKKEPGKAESLQNLLGTLGFTEGGFPYPLSAKYHMCLEGIPTENLSRTRDSAHLTNYMKNSIGQMRDLVNTYFNTIILEETK